MFDFSNILFQASIWVLPLLLAIPLHEAAHAYVAYRCGDDTALKLGRVSINPFKHIDPFGTIIMPALLIFFGAPFIFGFAKPVPVNFYNLRNPKIDMVWVALAGPGANFLLAVIGAVVLFIIIDFKGFISEWLRLTVYLVIHLNIVLGVFNLLPILPLDGGRVIMGIIPRRFAVMFSRTERYGLFFLLGLIFVLPLIGSQIGLNLNPLTWIIMPIVNSLESSLLTFIALI